MARIAGLFRRARLDRALDDEVRFHLGQIVISVVRHGLVLAITGVAIGAAAAILAAPVLRNAVYGVSTIDPATFLTVGVLLVPAVRALRLDPVSALRSPV